MTIAHEYGSTVVGARGDGGGVLLALLVVLPLLANVSCA